MGLQRSLSVICVSKHGLSKHRCPCIAETQIEQNHSNENSCQDLYIPGSNYLVCISKLQDPASDHEKRGLGIYSISLPGYE